MISESPAQSCNSQLEDDSPVAVAVTPLTTELINHILAMAVQSSADPRPGRKDASFLYPLLNVVGPRSEYPDMTKTAIARFCWWIDHDVASRLGDLSLIRLLDSMAALRPLQWSHKAIDDASTNAHAHVLEYWRSVKRTKGCLFSEEAIGKAAERGHVHVLKWWVAAWDELTLPHSGRALHETIIKYLAFGGQCELFQSWTAEYSAHLPWAPITPRVLLQSIAGAYSRPESTTLSTFHWLVSTFRIDLDCPAFRSRFVQTAPIASNDDLLANAISPPNLVTIPRQLALATIHFLEQYDLVHVVPNLAAAASVKAGNEYILERIYTHLLSHAAKHELRNMYKIASAIGATRVLDWLLEHDTVLPALPELAQVLLVGDCMRQAATAGAVEALDWWVMTSPYRDELIGSKRQAYPHCLNSVVLAAVGGDKVHVLEWFRNEIFGPEPERDYWPREIVTFATQCGAMGVLQWWKEHGEACRIVASGTIANTAFSSGQLPAVEFWVKEGRLTTGACRDILPFWDRDEDADRHGVWPTGVHGMKPRDRVFAWWIQSELAATILAASPRLRLAVFTALAFSKYPILLDLYLRKYGPPDLHVRKSGRRGLINQSTDRYRMEELKPVVLESCAERGRGYRCMAEHWLRMDVGVPASWKEADRACFEEMVRAMVDSSYSLLPRRYTALDRDLYFALCR